MRREVFEETGVLVRTLAELPARDYLGPKGQPIHCAMFLVEPEDPAAEPRRERPWDTLEWVPWPDVEAKLTHKNTKEYLKEIEETVRRTFFSEGP